MGSGSQQEPARTWAVFTKPWRTDGVDELAARVARMGFNAVEFPLRPGYQVDLDAIESSLPKLVTALAEQGLTIASVAGTPDDRTLAACADNGIDLLRVMVPFEEDGYLGTADVVHRRLDELVRLAIQHGVRIGVQAHCNYYVADSSELAMLIKDYDPAAITAIWDAAHDGLAGKRPRHTLPLLWDRLSMINFKNACYRRQGSGDTAEWLATFVEGSQGLCSWPEAAEVIATQGYRGPICLPAEYTDETDLERKVMADLHLLRTLLGEDR